jgi:hypothetical protein
MSFHVICLGRLKITGPKGDADGQYPANQHGKDL